MLQETGKSLSYAVLLLLGFLSLQCITPLICNAQKAAEIPGPASGVINLTPGDASVWGDLWVFRSRMLSAVFDREYASLPAVDDYVDGEIIKVTAQGSDPNYDYNNRGWNLWVLVDGAWVLMLGDLYNQINTLIDAGGAEEPTSINVVRLTGKVEDIFYQPATRPWIQYRLSEDLIEPNETIVYVFADVVGFHYPPEQWDLIRDDDNPFRSTEVIAYNLFNTILAGTAIQIHIILGVWSYPIVGESGQSGIVIEPDHYARPDRYVLGAGVMP